MEEEKNGNIPELVCRPKCLHSRRRKSISIVQTIALAASCVLSVAAFCFVAYNFFTKTESGEHLRKNETHCIQCLSKQEGINIKPNFKSNLPCCAVKMEYLRITIQNLEAHKKLKRESEQFAKSVSFSPASAHKFLLSSGKAMNFSNVDHVTVQISTTSNEKNSNNHARGVEINTEGITILYSGLYYVYSSIFYLPKTNISSEHFPYQTWFHYVYRTRPNSPAMSSVILRTVFTCCPNCANSKDSVYTGGIFHLMAGDVIQVCLSGQGLMGADTLQDDSSFLGLYMVASDRGA